MPLAEAIHALDNSSPLNWDVKRIWNLYANRFPIEDEDYYILNRDLAGRLFELTGHAEGNRDDGNDDNAQHAIDEFDRLWLSKYGETGLFGWIGMNTTKPTVE